MISTGILSILGLGFVLGLKHATDADHLIAVSTIVSERKGFWTSSVVGALWGFGHTVSLLVVGLLVVAFHFEIPDKVALAMEFCVALMLVALGANVLLKLWKGATLHLHVHEHESHQHAHLHFHEPGKEETHNHARPVGKKPFYVGMVHGMAGSAALMLLVLATIPSRIVGVLYISVFGIGSVGGMMIMSALIGIPFSITSKHRRLTRTIQFASGFLSVCFGIFYAWKVGFSDGLFL